MEDASPKTEILVAEGDRLLRPGLRSRLAAAGVEAVCSASAREAVALLAGGGHRRFAAVAADAGVGDVDGFALRDAVRGLDPTLPFFFLTARDPLADPDFFRRLFQDPCSFYVPRAADAESTVLRMRAVLGSRRAERLEDARAGEESGALELAALVQRSVLPPRAALDETTFYATCWRPKDAVSGDLYEALALTDGSRLYVLGDIQGHGTGAALSMMAVQSFLKRFAGSDALPPGGPADVANALQGFFAANLAGVSYMTALVCVHRPAEGVVDWISCGAPDPVVVDPAAPDGALDPNPEKRGGLPVGLLPDTLYGPADVVRTPLPPSAAMAAFTDGVLDLSSDADGFNQMPDELRRGLLAGIFADALRDGSLPAAPARFLDACAAHGYANCPDDVSALVFGARAAAPDVFETAVPIRALAIDREAERLGAWCSARGWGLEAATKVQIVFQEKLMNLHDHGIDPRDRPRETACVRVRRAGAFAELAVWDWGTPEPPLEFPAEGVGAAFERRNREFSGRGRGRLIVHEFCDDIARSRFGSLNETVYRVPLDAPDPAAR